MGGGSAGRARRGAARFTGPRIQTRRLVKARFDGQCVRCGQDGWSVHHRKPRGMGGSSDPAINDPVNLLWVCGTGTTGCHGWIEHNRVESKSAGWLVPFAVDPARIPVRLWDGRVVMLDSDGGFSHG